MSIVKTSVQVVIAEGATSELTGLLTQFITKYRNNTGLNIEQEVHHNYQQQGRQPLIELEEHNNIPEISNPEYHKPKGRPPKRYKSSTEENNKQHYVSLSSKTCSYCLEKGHNIKGCK